MTRVPRRGDAVDLDRTVTVVDGDHVRTEPLALLITRPTIVSVVAAAGLRDCDHQLAGVATVAPVIRAAGFGVMAVARDGPASVAETARILELDIVTVNDRDGSLARALGVRAPDVPRAVAVIDGLGTVREWCPAAPRGHGRQLLGLVDALRAP